MTMSLCLVTGGGGFIGSHLVDSLVARGHQVRVLDNFSTGNLSNLASARNKIDMIKGDVADIDSVRAAMKDVELVFHQATLSSVHRSVVDPLSTHQVCADGTLHVLLSAREQRVRRVIYGASASAYGDGAPLPRRENEPLRPISPYAVAKLAGEHYCAAFSYAYGLETVRLRYFNVFGPRQFSGSPYATVIPLFIEAMLAGRRPVIHGDGTQSRDFTYVDDVVQANVLAAEAPRASGKVYNIASGRSTTLLELVERINLILGTEVKPIHTTPRVGDIRHSFADITRAQADLGYCPCTDLGQCLRSCIDHYAAKRRGPKHLRREAYHFN
jgi:UDP-glucose 4-epimerase